MSYAINDILPQGSKDEDPDRLHKLNGGGVGRAEWESPVPAEISPADRQDSNRPCSAIGAAWIFQKNNMPKTLAKWQKISYDDSN